MILRILIALVILIVVIFIGFWIVTGGPSRGFSFAKGIDNPFDYFTSTTTGVEIRLPGQPDELLDGVDITQYTDEAYGTVSGMEGGGAAYDRLNQLQAQYDELYAKAKDPKNFGNPSPYRDKIVFGYSSAQASAPATEYLVLQADYRNTAPVSLAGWSLQSAVTGARLPIPAAAPMFISGVLNATAAVVLDPGGSAVVTSGISPVGVSFRENRCTGYLAELQTYEPVMEKNCPTAETELPLTAQNIQTYGDACIDYVRTVPQCHFPGTDPNVAMSEACKNFLLNRLSYNGCSNAHRAETNFFSQSWRLYLSSARELWRDTHDVIRLLDERGQTVDVLTY